MVEVKPAAGAWPPWGRRIVDGLAMFVRDVGNGMLEVSHNLLALVGLAFLAACVFVASQAELRHAIEVRAFGWLTDRHSPRTSPAAALAPANAAAEPLAVDRATAVELSKLPTSQAAVASWLSRRYRVATEPVARLVQEAWMLGKKTNLEPTLILAIMAIESSFNPFAQSSVGAQGLMQVMTRVHDEKFAAFGGNHAAFDPVSNLRVGVQILKDCIARAGSIEGGLKHYVGAANLPDDGGYAARVLAEQAHLKQVAAGKSVAPDAPRNTAAFSSAVSSAPSESAMPAPTGGPAATPAPAAAVAAAIASTLAAAEAQPSLAMPPAAATAPAALGNAPHVAPPVQAAPIGPISGLAEPAAAVPAARVAGL
jgi:hypothetical protein